MLEATLRRGKEPNIVSRWGADWAWVGSDEGFTDLLSARMVGFE